ncbi:LysM peptidoglycan-binding domain-containing protein [Glutamicibacter sp. X7]
MGTLALDATTKAAPLKIKINRRGWAVLVGIPVFALTVAAAFFVAMFFNSAQASSAAPQGQEFVEVTVIPGDTLWGLAREHAGEHDIYSAMQYISEINSIEYGEIQAGDTLQIPVLD